LFILRPVRRNFKGYEKETEHNDGPTPWFIFRADGDAVIARQRVVLDLDGPHGG